MSIFPFGIQFMIRCAAPKDEKDTFFMGKAIHLPETKSAVHLDIKSCAIVYKVQCTSDGVFTDVLSRDEWLRFIPKCNAPIHVKYFNQIDLV